MADKLADAIEDLRVRKSEYDAAFERHKVAEAEAQDAACAISEASRNLDFARMRCCDAVESGEPFGTSPNNLAEVLSNFKIHVQQAKRADND